MESTAIYKFLQDTHGSRLSYDNKWLVWDIDNWVVYQHPYAAKKVRCLYRGINIDKALEILKEDK